MSFYYLHARFFERDKGALLKMPDGSLNRETDKADCREKV